MLANEKDNPVYTDNPVDFSNMSLLELYAYAYVLAGIVKHYQRHCTCMHDNYSFTWTPDNLLEVINVVMTLDHINPIILN